MESKRVLFVAQVLMTIFNWVARSGFLLKPLDAPLHSMQSPPQSGDPFQPSFAGDRLIIYLNAPLS